MDKRQDYDAVRVPDYNGACIANLVPTALRFLARNTQAAALPSLGRLDQVIHRIGGASVPLSSAWIPERLSGAEQVVVLVLDGLGYNQLKARLSFLPAFSEMDITAIDSVAPTTTAAALTSITTGVSPARHGIIGYRMRIGPSEVLNALKWTSSKEFERPPDPKSMQVLEPFLGIRPAVVTKSVYDNTGFTKAHLRGARPYYWRTFSGIVSRVRELLRDGERFIYLYYEGIDTTAHEFGLADQFDTELAFVDFFLSRLFEVLGSSTVLLVTADHGQVQVDEPPIHLSSEILSNVHFQSGEGRFRWLHVRGGSGDEVRDRCIDLYGKQADILSRQEIIASGLFGPDIGPEVCLRLGDVAIIAKEPVAFFDPLDTGPFNLISRHGGLTADELEVPLLSWSP